MKYKNAQDILPDRLVKELQQYISGEILYIPRPDAKKEWGAVSGARYYYQERNGKIRRRFESGETVDMLAVEFNLSSDSIRKIVRGVKKADN